MNKKNYFLIIAILFIAISRIIPHIPNFTPVCATALFAGAMFGNKKLGIVIPLLAMFISDCVLQLIYGYGFHSLMIVIYASMVLISLIGQKLQNNLTFKSIFSYTFLSSVLFFLITNFAVWCQGGYGYSISGITTCYIAAIPFFTNSILGDLFYGLILFGSYYFVILKNLKKEKIQNYSKSN